MFTQSKLVPLVAGLLLESTLAKIGINTETRQLIDEHGRSLLLHGVNVVYKVDPYIPSEGAFDANDSLNSEDIANLQKWGMNFVRLGVMWEGVEREPGVYDQKYLTKVDQLITKLGQAGIYTLVDAHQDVFARTICGEGVPDFYAKDVIGDKATCLGPLDQVLKPFYEKYNFCHNMEDYGYSKDSNGDYLIADCQKHFFADYYTSPQSMKAFDALYTNRLGLQDKFVEFWDATSAALTHNPFVVGFDPLNEPYPGNVLRRPDLLLPGNFDRKRLQPLYTRVFERYIKNDADSLMFFEPGTFPDVLGYYGGIIVPVGFTNPPGAEIGSRNHVLNDHTYCCQLNSTVCAKGEPSTDLASECYAWHEKRIGTRKQDADRLGVPLIISEFGACLTEAPCTQEIRQVTEVADEHLAGWAYWEFKNYEDLTTSAGTGSEGFYNQDGSLQDWKVKAMARTYLQFTQGTPTLNNFNMDNSEFTAKFIVDTSITQPTQIYLSTEYYYPQSWTYQVLSDGKLLDQNQFTSEKQGNLELIHINDSTLQGKEITIEVKAI